MGISNNLPLLYQQNANKRIPVFKRLIEYLAAKFLSSAHIFFFHFVCVRLCVRVFSQISHLLFCVSLWFQIRIETFTHIAHIPHWALTRQIKSCFWFLGKWATGVVPLEEVNKIVWDSLGWFSGDRGLVHKEAGTRLFVFTIVGSVVFLLYLNWLSVHTQDFQFTKIAALHPGWGVSQICAVLFVVVGFGLSLLVDKVVAATSVFMTYTQAYRGNKPLDSCPSSRSRRVSHKPGDAG